MKKLTAQGFINETIHHLPLEGELITYTERECVKFMDDYAKLYHDTENKKIWNELPESNELPEGKDLDLLNTSPLLRDRNLFVLGADTMKEKVIPVISKLKNELYSYHDTFHNFKKTVELLASKNKEQKTDIARIIKWIKKIGASHFDSKVSHEHSISDLMEKYKNEIK